MLTAFSQTGQINGKVLDSKTQEPLPFANVFINNTTIGVAADANGDFTFSGFFGDYEITATKGRTQRTKSTLAKGAMNEWVVHLGS